LVTAILPLMSLNAGNWPPLRCKEACDVPDTAGELQIAELRQMPWAYFTAEPQIMLFRAGASESKSSSSMPSGQGGSRQLDSFSNRDGNTKVELEERSRILVDDGAYYCGQWNGDMRHGHGKLERSKWGIYDGEFVNGKATGSGHFVKDTGDEYRGQWLNDRAHGHGHYVHCDGSTYLGQWDADLKSGKGVETWPDCSTYQGEFLAGRKHGHGLYQACDNSSFDGQFTDDMMHGTGNYAFSDGRTYRGHWERSRMMGDGCMEWSDGRSYVGQFQDDRKWGWGKFYWPDGRAYDGQWFRGKQHGHGVFISRKGRRSAGEWVNGKTNMTSLSRVSSVGSLNSVMAPQPEGTHLLAAMDDSEMHLLGKLEDYTHLHMSERQESRPMVTQEATDQAFAYIVDIDGREQ